MKKYTARNYPVEAVLKKEPTTMVYQGHQLDHINYFVDGSIVGYEDEAEEKFIVVLKATTN